MADDNKVLKYTRYAIGEIILVVIGILIALQINTWNQERLILKDQIAVLKKLSRDLDSDYLRFVKIDSFYNSHLEVLKHQKKLILKNNLTNVEVEEVMHFSGASFQELSPRRTAYDEMLNSGKLYNLSNDDLVDEIIEYYRNVEDDIYHIRQTRNEYRNLIYGPELTDYWYWKGGDEPFNDARVFYNNQDTNAYKLLKQSAGWGVSIVNNNLKNIALLIKQNRELNNRIDTELEILK